MHKKRKIIKIVAICIVSLCIIMIVSYVLRIKNINCHTQFGACSSEFVNRLSFLKDKSILKSPQIDILNQQFQNEPLYKSGKMQRVFPNSINVTIEMRIPIGAVKGQNDKQFGLVDEEGKIISVVEVTNMSVLQVDTWSPDIKTLAPVHVSSLKMLQSVGQIAKTPVIGQLTDLGLVVNSKQMPTIILDPKSELSQWYSTLQVIIDRSKIQNKMPKKIDLRFNQPVLEY